MAFDSRNPVGAVPRAFTALVGPTLPSGPRQKALTVTGILVSSGLLAILASVSTKYAVLAGLGILAVGLYAVAPMALVGAAIPATLLVARVGTASSNLSVSDLVLFVSTIAALPFMRLRDATTMKRLFGLLAVYEAALLITIVDNPYQAGAIEWAHELFLVGGSLIIGWVVARNGYSKPALSVFLGGSTIIALWASADAVTTHFQPVNLPLGMQKNFIGVILMFAVFVAFLNPDWVGWTGRWHRLAMYLCVLGILASQSRQAMIGCALGVVVASFRSRKAQDLSRRSKIILLVTGGLLIISYVTISREFASNNRFNSVHQRLQWFQQSLQVWRTSPWLGVGLRWWNSNRFSFHFQPPNGEMEMISSAGIVGLAAFLYLFGRSLVVLWRVPARFGTLAFTAVLMRFVEGQFDIFWVTAVSAIPWMLAGLALGAMARSDSGEEGLERAGPVTRLSLATWPP
jgi:polysaccharide biosynthesis protein PslJ